MREGQEKGGLAIGYRTKQSEPCRKGESERCLHTFNSTLKMLPKEERLGIRGVVERAANFSGAAAH